MTSTSNDICDEVFGQLRKIVRAMDIHSRQLQRNHALTAPQLVLLREIVRHDRIASGVLAKRVSLGNATVTGIVDRLEQRGLVERIRNGQDRRQVLLSSTEKGRTLSEQAPSLLQEQFIAALSGLQDKEQEQILKSLSHLATMMGSAAESTPIINDKLESTEQDKATHEGAITPDAFLTSCQMLLDKTPASATPATAGGDKDSLALCTVRSVAELPEETTRASLIDFLHEHLHPYEDTKEDIGRGLDYALSPAPGQGGFVVLAQINGQLAGALVMLDTGMSGYVPEQLLLFVAVDAVCRGQGIGAQVIKKAQEQCRGDIKLHVEYHNPARRLYERMGFASKYAEMRWLNESRND